jgi:hypothetical protein
MKSAVISAAACAIALFTAGAAHATPGDTPPNQGFNFWNLTQAGYVMDLASVTGGQNFASAPTVGTKLTYNDPHPEHGSFWIKPVDQFDQETFVSYNVTDPNNKPVGTVTLHMHVNSIGRGGGGSATCTSTVGLVCQVVGPNNNAYTIPVQLQPQS